MGVGIPLLRLIVPATRPDVLPQAIASVPETPEIEVIVVADGSPGCLEQLPKERVPHVRSLLLPEKHNDFGGAARTHGIRFALSSPCWWIGFLDDDDQWAPGAWQSIRPELVRRLTPWPPQDVPIFQMRYRDGNTLWRTESLECGNVGTGMFFLPSDGGPMPIWHGTYTGDFGFLSEFVSLRGVECRWIDQVVLLVRP